MMQYPPHSSMNPEMSQRAWFEQTQAQLYAKGIQVMQSCSLHLQAAETNNVEEEIKLSATCDSLMAEYEKLSESLVEMLRAERDWEAILAEYLSQTPPQARPRFSTPGMRAPLNAAPEVALKEEELPTEITDGRELLTLEWYPNTGFCRTARVVMIEPMGDPCVHCLLELFFIDRLTTVQISIDVAKMFVA